MIVPLFTLITESFFQVISYPYFIPKVSMTLDVILTTNAPIDGFYFPFTLIFLTYVGFIPCDVKFIIYAVVCLTYVVEYRPCVVGCLTCVVS